MSDFSPKQLELLAAIDRVVEERADHARAIQEKNVEIASLCADARAANIIMRVLASHVKLYDPKTEQLRSVTRQSVDGMIAELEGRRVAPRVVREDDQAPSNGGRVNMAAFS